MHAVVKVLTGLSPGSELVTEGRSLWRGQAVGMTYKRKA